MVPRGTRTSGASNEIERYTIALHKRAFVVLDVLNMPRCSAVLCNYLGHCLLSNGRPSYTIATEKMRVIPALRAIPLYAFK